MENSVYALELPAVRRSCAVFSSPHSGADYPAAFLGASLLTPLQIRSSEDAFVDELFAAAPAAGAPLLAARVPRACLDLNRAPDDLDPALIAGASRRFLNPRIAAGLGVIPRVVGEGRPIMRGQAARWPRRSSGSTTPGTPTTRASGRSSRRRGRSSAGRSCSTATRCRTTRWPRRRRSAGGRPR